MVIGVHSNKFPNEAETENIRQAILRHGLEHPVVNDSDFKIWKAYSRFGVQGWPSFILIDPVGNIVGYASGEGNYPILDAAIAQQLKKFKKELKPSLPKFALEKEKEKPRVLAYPGKILAAGERLFIADTNHHRILVADKAGKVEHVIGGSPGGRKDGGYTVARFDEPQGMALQGNTLFVADRQNHSLRAVDLEAKTVATIAGTGKRGYRRPGDFARGPAGATPLASPWALALDGDRLFIAMAGSHQIWMMDLAKKDVGPYSGSGRETLTNGLHAEAAFNQPSGLSIGGRKLYVADSEISGIREVDLEAKGGVRTILGTGLFDFGDKDGIGDAARLQHVIGVVWHEGKLYIADSYNHKIKVCDPKTREVKTFLGDGKPGSDEGKSPRFFEPAGLSVDGGMLYIADMNNHSIRVCELKTGEVRTLEISLPKVSK